MSAALDLLGTGIQKDNKLPYTQGFQRRKTVETCCPVKQRGSIKKKAIVKKSVNHFAIACSFKQNLKN